MDEQPRFHGRYLKATLAALLGFILLVGGFIWTAIALLAGSARGALTPTLVTLAGAIGFYLAFASIRRLRRAEKKWFHDRGMKAPGEGGTVDEIVAAADDADGPAADEEDISDVGAQDDEPELDDALVDDDLSDDGSDDPR